MPGRTVNEAIRAFTDPLREAIACVARANLSITGGPSGSRRENVPYSLLTNGGRPVDLGGRHNLQMHVRMRFEVVRRPELEGGPFKVKTLAYSYKVEDNAGMGVLDFHWHPDGHSHVRVPHLHVDISQLNPAAILTNRSHVATGRVSLESVIRQLITDHDVEARVPDWKDRLDLSDGLFRLHRSWS